MTKYHIWTIETMTHRVCYEVVAKNKQEAERKGMALEGKQIKDEVDEVIDAECESVEKVK